MRHALSERDERAWRASALRIVIIRSEIKIKFCSNQT